jgi:ketosteroid isomerase-like protein
MKMTPEEIHQFGIEIVHGQLIKDGYEIKAVYTEVGTSPQIVAEKNGNLAFIAVRTACYPEKGKLEENVHFKMIEQAGHFNAIPYFASVGIAAAEAKSDAERSIPIKGAGFHVAYEGLLVIARSDRVRVLDVNGLQYLSCEAPQKEAGIAHTEKDAVISFAKAWNRLDCTGFLQLLAEDATYESQWVFKKLEGRDAIAHYLTGKMQTIKASEKTVRAELSTVRCAHDFGRYCVVLKQDENRDNDAVMIIEVENGKIKRCDLCAPELFDPELTNIYPI